MAKKLLFVFVLLSILAAASAVEAKTPVAAGTMVVVDFANGAKLLCKTDAGLAAGKWAEGLYYPASDVMPAVGTNCNRIIDPAKEKVVKVTVGGMEVPIFGVFNPTTPFGK